MVAAGLSAHLLFLVCGACVFRVCFLAVCIAGGCFDLWSWFFGLPVDGCLFADSGCGLAVFVLVSLLFVVGWLSCCLVGFVMLVLRHVFLVFLASCGGFVV